MRLLGLAGYKGSGKDTAAEPLIAEGYTRMAFADFIREMLIPLGLTDNELTTGKDQPLHWLPDHTPRDLLISLGTGWGRKMVDPDLWVEAMRRKLQLHQLIGDVVITDVRFENEARMIREMGGTIIHVIREPEARWKRWLRRLTKHRSEWGVKYDPEADWMVPNQGTIEELHSLTLTTANAIFSTSRTTTGK